MHQLKSEAAPVVNRGERPETSNPNSANRSGLAQRARLYLALAPMVVLVVAWLWTVYVALVQFNPGPNGAGMGTDFAIFYSGAQVMRDGENPYDHRLLYQTESSFMRQEHLPMTREGHIVLAGNPPLFFWALQPLTRLPFQPAALGWIASMWVLSALGLLGALRYFGWRRRIIPCLLFLALPQVILGAYDGNVDGLVFAGIGGSLALLRRHPVAAGMVAALAWLKPQVALPVVLLMVLFHSAQWKRYAAGFLAATAGLSGLTAALAGPGSFGRWMGGLTGFSQATAVEPKLASLVGVYAQWAPSTVRLGLEVCLLLTAIVATAAMRWRTWRLGELTVLAVGWLWTWWMLATPFAHYYDEILLAVPLLALMGRDASRIGRALPLAALYMMFVSVFLLRWTPFHVQLLALPLLGVLICLARASAWPESRSELSRT